MKLSFYSILFIFIFQILAVPVRAQTLEVPPEKATGYLKKEEAVSSNYMIVTANPIATQAGYDILEKGGTAADAAFAAQLVLGLVEPQSSGLGGGGFALYWDNTARQLYSYDGRETAPSSVKEDWFLTENGAPMSFYDASIGGRAVGIPGTPQLLEVLRNRHGGEISEDDIFGPAMELAEYGFTVSPRLAQLIILNKQHLRFFKSAKDYFTPNSSPVLLNQNITNTDYLNTLKKFKKDGSKIFYSGKIAENIRNTVNDAWHNPGKVIAEDFTSYKVKERLPVCGRYRTYKICSMGEPSSGGLTLIQALKILDRFDLETLSPTDMKAWHLIAEASRLAFADRNKFMADPDFVKTPGVNLIDPAYIAVRSSLIQPDTALEKITAGIPPKWQNNHIQAEDKSKEKPGTTHIVAIDRYGNSISMTSSIETAFGAKIMTDGFLLNNQLTDFSFIPEENGKKVANRIEGGKRPRSSMTPVIIFDENENPVLVIGSAGGSRIIGYILQRIISVLDWGIPIQEALSMPNILARGQEIEVEQGFDGKFSIETLREYGHKVEIGELNSGLTAAYFKDRKWHGAADPRREGIALGGE